MRSSLAAFVGASSLGVPALAHAISGSTSADPEANARFWAYPRWVWLRRPASGEVIRIEYWRDGSIDEQAHRALSWFLRDVRFERMLQTSSPIVRKAYDGGRIRREQLSPWMMMDPILLDILYAYCAWLSFYGVSRPLVVTSGLRHPLTNELTEGAARDSWHTRGGAADFLIEGIDQARVASFGRWLSGGGVGLYVRKNFVHVDRGRVRTWIG